MPQPSTDPDFEATERAEASAEAERVADLDARAEAHAAPAALVRCGDCRWFVRDGECSFLASPEGQDRARPFAHAPFWVWSDCYSDREQVRRDVTSACPTFAPKMEV